MTSEEETSPANIDTDCIINSLPTELLLQIFSPLSIKERIKIERVCKKWKEVNTQFIWTPVKHQFNFLNKYLRYSKIECNNHIVKQILFRIGFTLREIDFSQCSKRRLPKDFAYAIGFYCPNLEVMNLNNTSVTDLGLKCISEGCPNLKDVKLAESHYISDRGLGYLLQNCAVKRLDISLCQKIKGSCFVYFKDCIRWLSLNSCYRLYENSWENLKTAAEFLEYFFLPYSIPAYQDLLRFQRKLTELEMEQIYTLTPSLMRDIVKHCTQLITLNLRQTNIIDDLLMPLRNLPNLRNLYLSNSQIRGSGLINVSLEGLLEHVECSSCFLLTDSACIAMITNCPRLTYLDIRECEKITNNILVTAKLVVKRKGRFLKILAGGTEINEFVKTENLHVIGYEYEDSEAGNPDAGNPDAENPDAENPDAENPDAENPDAENLEAGNPEAGNPEAGNPEAGNPAAGNPEAGNPEADAGNPEPEAENPEAAAENPEAAAENPEAEAENPEAEAENPEAAAENPEAEAENPDAAAENPEAEAEDPEAGNLESDSDSDEFIDYEPKKSNRDSDSDSEDHIDYTTFCLMFENDL